MVIIKQGEEPRVRIEDSISTIEIGRVYVYRMTTERGDTLDEIAARVGTKPKVLYNQNKDVLGDDLKRVQLQPGMKLTYVVP